VEDLLVQAEGATIENLKGNGSLPEYISLSVHTHVAPYEGFS